MTKSNLLFIDDDRNIIEGYHSIFKSNPRNKSRLEDPFGVDPVVHGELVNNVFDLFSATQGEDGVKIVQERIQAEDPIDVVFIDMRMPPGMGGAETAKRIREIDSDVEIVIVTAFSDQNLADVGQEVGRMDKLLYLKKPFDPIEVKQIAKNLAEKSRLEKVKSDFIANVNHELATPLSAVMGFLELSLMEEGLPENVRAMLEVSQRNSCLLKQLIDDLVMSAFVQQNSFKFNYSSASVNELVGDVTKTLEVMAKNASKDHLDIQCDLLTNDAIIECDPVRLKQALLNLSYNALKFTDKGQIDILSRDLGDCIEFSVADTGFGIPKDKQELIFERFVRIEDEHHEVPGFGLGLSIVKSIVANHEGSISVDSVLGQGSKFTIVLNKRRSS